MDAIGVWPAPWADRCMLEANKFWFYSLIFSLLSGMFQLFFGSSSRSSRERKASPKKLIKKKPSSALNSGRKERQKIRRRLIADAFDLLIPGHVTRWIPSNLVVVGFASVISTTLSSKDRWDRLR